MKKTDSHGATAPMSSLPVSGGDKLRCKPGDRCVIVETLSSGKRHMNGGRIVLVVRHYRSGEIVCGTSDWAEETDPPNFHWVITPLGDGLKILTPEGGATELAWEMPIPDRHLIPLGEDEGGIEDSALRPLLALDRTPPSVCHRLRH